MKKIIESALFPIKCWTNDIEVEAIEQLSRIANLPFIYKHIAVMPDVHAGKGSTVGSVIATSGTVIPSAIGVDIGCGIIAVKVPLTATNLASDKVLKRLRENIETAVPVGTAMHKSLHNRVIKKFASSSLSTRLTAVEQTSKEYEKALYQMGTLGGGNHFVEICLDNNSDVWVMLHSGSRYIGKIVAEKHILYAKGALKQAHIYLEDPELAYLSQGASEFQNYIQDMQWCQHYAYLNREEMMYRVLWELSKMFFKGEKHPDNLSLLRINCHHNYTQEEEHYGQKIWVTRKGAISAKVGELGIIPGSMGTKSYIVRGLGNPESFNSCSHGAGRRLSRTKAKTIFTAEDIYLQTAGIECRKDAGILDELPLAYKDIDQVMANQTDLVEIVYQLKQVLCVKG